MSVKNFRIVSISRSDRNGILETHKLEKGVNVLVGEPNTGKTRWLETIDFILGDDGKADDKLGEVIFDKYESATVTLEIGEEILTVQRKWHAPGGKTKIFVGETAHEIGEFRQLILDRTGIPSLNYPQGNPYGARTWPELGWRSLVRHLYRRQRFWGDIADQQPASEQHACILQFLGLAEKLFSAEFGALIKKQKEISNLEARKEQFTATLNEITREIVSEAELGIAVTPDAILQATTRLTQEIQDLTSRRDRILKEAISTASVKSSKDNKDAISRMTELYAKNKEQEKVHSVEFERVNSRLLDLESLLQKIGSEIGRLQRAQKSGEVLANLKVTHCPVCDQSIKQGKIEPKDSCYLCGLAVPVKGPTLSDSFKRLDFELEQLDGEHKELTELIESLTAKKKAHVSAIQELRNESSRLHEMLKPIRMATAAVFPPEVAVIDNEIGRRVERMDQLRRIRESLDRREQLAADILKIQEQVQQLTSEVSKQSVGVDFETSSDDLSDAMNDYVRQLQFDGKNMWTQNDIQFSVKKDGFNVRVGRQKWASQLGGTMIIYFLLSYHYALMKLSKFQNTRVPGFLIIDFPAEIEGEKVADHENFVIEPFIKLSKTPGYENLQVIAAGSAFKGLDGAHRIELSHVWTG